MGAKYTTARLSVGGEHFEILVDPDAALSFKLGKPASIRDILVVDVIFTDAGKGMKASEEKLQKAFQTADPMKVAEAILRNGELQLTTEQRHRNIEDKRKQIINYIFRHSIDPRTGLPHPPLRIEQAMKQVRLAVDPFKDAKEQAKLFMEELRPILPLKTEEITVAIKVPPEFAAVSIGVVKEFGRTTREEWQADGSWVALVEVPAGLHISLIEKLERITRGTLQTKILK